jgi:hypothetical protein
MSAGHSVAFTLDPAFEVTYRCHEPDTAPCKRICRESACEEGCHDPAVCLPDTEPYDGCHILDWLDNEGDPGEAFRGPRGTPVRDGEIDVQWDSDGVTWTYPKSDGATP